MQENQQRSTPSTNEEWSIHVLNIHGTFFERRCQEVIQSDQQWKIVDTNHAVEYRGQASNLDIWAARDIEKHSETRRLTLPIECKKNNPDFVDWIFFPQPVSRTADPWVQALQVSYPNFADTFTFNRALWSLEHDIVIADEARETKGDYLTNQRQQNKTKTSNDAITKAAVQISLATQALVIHELALLQALINAPATYSPPYNKQFFFPTIVTTANLFICQFQVTDIDLTKGEISFDKAQLKSIPYLLFNYALPTTLQLTSSDIGLNPTFRETFVQLARLPILVVHSTAFPVFLQRIGNNLRVNDKAIEIQLQPN